MDNQLNIIEIEEEIKKCLCEIQNPIDLLSLKKWAKKAKKNKPVKPTATSFKQVYYTFERPVRSSGSGKFIGRKTIVVDYTSFIFLGIEINLPFSDKSYIFSDDNFNCRPIWIDRFIKYGGKEYFPKMPIAQYCGINLEEMFFNYIKDKGFYILKKNEKSYFLCNDNSNARKLMIGKRLTQFDLCNNPVIKISKEHIDYLHFLEVKMDL